LQNTKELQGTRRQKRAGHLKDPALLPFSKASKGEIDKFQKRNFSIINIFININTDVMFQINIDIITNMFIIISIIISNSIKIFGNIIEMCLCKSSSFFPTV